MCGVIDGHEQSACAICSHDRVRSLALESNQRWAGQWHVQIGGWRSDLGKNTKGFAQRVGKDGHRGLSLQFRQSICID